MQAYFTNDAIVLGLLMAVLAIIFYLESSKKPFWVKFFTYVPSLLLCYFVPALLKWPLGLVDGEVSQLYYVASRYLLPAALILLCLGIDFKGIMRLGPKAIIMFLAGTIGIILGGPIALLVIEYLFPSLIPSNLSVNELWRGMSTIAGSWIGGGANQTAMKEVFEVADNIFGIMIVVDVIVANIWMGFLLYGANIRDKANRLLKADNTAILDLEKRMEDYNASVKKIPTTTEVFILMAVAFGGVALAHWGADIITPFMEERIESLKNMNLQSLASGFFWLVVIATTIGLALSFTSARKLEGVGATRWGSVFIYVLVATIGMKMDLAQIFDKDNIGLFLIGLTWMLVHVIILLLVAKMIKAPFFFVAVGSQANVGGAASAPIVASAFNPSLASVGVLMAVLGYALGTYGALICAILMEMVATG
ncbi:putative integral membrane protein [Candidatus Ornithobacterium hominis]|uniref:DUF819 family protein n=1 Tax=Candidatus Ornithobacterium hominis TaxID=2497989 RepID=UPI0024BD1CA9|nr:DUF819 family protein [Candidatus Ornithobacterium hominis]CAI9429645.1 putative integral membrane protein [Candidatus Ornithobacterium hominis]